jgi:hypothetical protein
VAAILRNSLYDLRDEEGSDGPTGENGRHFEKNSASMVGFCGAKLQG